MMQGSFSSVVSTVFLIIVLIWAVVLIISLVTLSRRRDIFMPVKIFWSVVIVIAPFAGLLVYLIYGPKKRV
jgi:hypothetical protein